MKSLRVLFCLLRWDLLREMRRKDTVFNMVFFAMLILFLVSIGIGPLFEAYRGAEDERLAGLESRVGPVIYWIAVLFAGTVGLSQTFAAEREGGALQGVLLAPVEPGLFYLAKVAAAWIYVVVMELLLLGVYAVLFHLSGAWNVGALLLCLALFSLGYMAAGVVLAAMTSTLRRGGEVVLRLLLFPVLLPLLLLTLRVPEATFGVDVAAGYLGPPLAFTDFVGMTIAIDAIYLTTGFLVFPKILEE